MRPTNGDESPAANSRHWSDAGVPFNVEASSPNGPIARLDLFAVYREPPNWPTVPHYMTSWAYQVPWKETWNGLFPADYELVAVATDTSGVAEASEPIPFSVRIRNDDLPERSGSAERQQAMLDVVPHCAYFVTEYGG